MTTRDDDGGLGAEVSDRLDALFGDDEGPAPVKPPEPEKSKNPLKKAASAAIESGDDSPISNLKALVFSIDWEISDATMVDFLKETKRLSEKYKNDQILSLFLKLHDSIGKYIKAKKARAHPDAIKFVASLYKSFEKVVLSPGMPEKQKKQILSTEVAKFKQFKERVLLKDGAEAEVIEAREAPVAAVAEARPESRPAAAGAPAALASKEALDYIVEQLKKEIKSEFATIRQIIKNLGA